MVYPYKKLLVYEVNLLVRFLDARTSYVYVLEATIAH